MLGLLAFPYTCLYLKFLQVRQRMLDQPEQINQQEQQIYKVKIAFPSHKYNLVNILLSFLAGLGDHALGQVLYSSSEPLDHCRGWFFLSFFSLTCCKQKCLQTRALQHFKCFNIKWQTEDDEYKICQVLLRESSVWTNDALGGASKVLVLAGGSWRSCVSDHSCWERSAEV